MTTYQTKFSEIPETNKKQIKIIESKFPFVAPDSNLGNMDICGQFVSKNADIGTKIKFCPICDLPMIVKMQVLPCEHMMCYSCTQPDKGYCYICENKIESVTRINDNAKLYECDFPDCFRFFLSSEKLNLHKYNFHFNGHIEQNITNQPSIQNRPNQTNPPVGQFIGVVPPIVNNPNQTNVQNFN